MIEWTGLRERLKDWKLLLIFALVLMAAAIILIEPNINPVYIKIEDKCGKFINVMSHTVEDEAECRIRCRSQCESADKRYRKVEFEKSDIACNTCHCYCK